MGRKCGKVCWKREAYQLRGDVCGLVGRNCFVSSEPIISNFDIPFSLAVAYLNFSFL
jgi:hypothetical protein